MLGVKNNRSTIKGEYAKKLKLKIIQNKDNDKNSKSHYGGGLKIKSST